MSDNHEQPSGEAGWTINPDAKPRQVKAWLARLDAGQPQAAALALLKFISASNRHELDEARRLEQLELIEPVALKMHGALRWQYLKAPPPLDMTRQSLADLAAALLAEMAESYQLLIGANLEPTFRLFGSDPLPQLFRRRIHWLHQCLVHHFEIHAAVPEGLWLWLHQCYTLCARMGHADSVDAEGQAATDLYRAALLLAIADPYRMPDHELPWALGLIASHGHLARLIPASASQLRPGNYAVDHHRDQPPFALARGQDPMLQAWSYSLSTTELVKYLTWLLNALPSLKTRPDVPEAASLRDPRYPAFLQRMQRQWSASFQRLQQRRPCERPMDYELVAGLASLTALLDRPSPDRPGAEQYQATNVSAGGMTLRKSGEVRQALQVGIVVGLRSKPGEVWQPGVIRWLRVPSQGEVEFGVQFLPPHAHAVQLLPAGVMALLLCTQPGLPESGLLVAQAGSLGTGREVQLLVAGQTRAVRLDKEVNLAPDLAAWRISLAD